MTAFNLLCRWKKNILLFHQVWQASKEDNWKEFKIKSKSENFLSVVDKNKKLNNLEYNFRIF